MQARVAGLAQISDVALLNRWRQAEDWYLLPADAGYCSVAGIEYVTRQKAHVLIGVNPSHFPLIDAAGERLSWLSFLEPVTGAGQVGDGEARLRGRGEHSIALPAGGVLCAKTKRPFGKHDNGSKKRLVESNSTREPKRGATPNMYWSSAVGPSRPAHKC